jgi:hypothetical protein
MRKLVPSILLYVVITSLLSVSAEGKRLKAAPVVAKFGGECKGVTFHPTPRLKRLIEKSKQRMSSSDDRPCCSDAFAYDLNGDGGNEYFVRLACGATGNCTWGIFSEQPARLRGTFTAWFFYIHRRVGSWNALTTYTREGGDQGVIVTLANRQGKYVQKSERTERGDYRDPQPFLTRMGVPKCS